MLIAQLPEARERIKEMRIWVLGNCVEVHVEIVLRDCGYRKLFHLLCIVWPIQSVCINNLIILETIRRSNHPNIVVYYLGDFGGITICLFTNFFSYTRSQYIPAR